VHEKEWKKQRIEVVLFEARTKMKKSKEEVGEKKVIADWEKPRVEDGPAPRRKKGAATSLNDLDSIGKRPFVPTLSPTRNIKGNSN